MAGGVLRSLVSLSFRLQLENLLLDTLSSLCINVGKLSEGNGAERIPEVVHLRCSTKLDSFWLWLLVGVRCSDVSSMVYW